RTLHQLAHVNGIIIVDDAIMTRTKYEALAGNHHGCHQRVRIRLSVRHMDHARNRAEMFLRLLNAAQPALGLLVFPTCCFSSRRMYLSSGTATSPSLRTR